MPLVQVTLGVGRSPEQKRMLLAKVADAVQESTGAALETIRVWITEVPLEEFSVGGVPLDEVRAARERERCEAEG